MWTKSLIGNTVYSERKRIFPISATCDSIWIRPENTTTPKGHSLHQVYLKIYFGL